MDELLKLLQGNALESHANLGKLLNKPAADVSKEIAAYEKTGVIRGYQAVLDEDKLDLDRVTAVIEVKVTPQREGGFNNIATRISKFPEVKDKVDFCSYWLRLSHEYINAKGRVGLVGTNTISQGNTRKAGLDYITQNSGIIHDAISSQVWSGDAKVHVSIVNWCYQYRLHGVF
jgi:hypothetical protein